MTYPELYTLYNLLAKAVREHDTTFQWGLTDNVLRLHNQTAEDIATLIHMLEQKLDSAYVLALNALD